MSKLPVAVLISGNGSNLQALIDANINIDIRVVISNNPEAYGLIRAKNANIPTITLMHQNFANRDTFDAALQEKIDSYTPELIILAGFMRKLGPNIVRKYTGKMINIHPSLLPKYPGLDTHHRAIQAKDEEHGASIHFVTDDIDAGPIISQAKLTVNHTDTPETLKTRIQQLEHKLYPDTIKLFAQRRIRLVGDTVLLDDKPIK